MKWLCIDFLLVQPFQQKLKNTTFFWNRLYLVKNRTSLVLPCQKNVTSLVRFFTRYSRFQKNVVFLSFCWNGCTSKKSIQSHFIYYISHHFALTMRGSNTTPIVLRISCSIKEAVVLHFKINFSFLSLRQTHSFLICFFFSLNFQFYTSFFIFSFIWNLNSFELIF